MLSLTVVASHAFSCQHFLNRNQLIDGLQLHQFKDTILQAEDNEECVIADWNVSSVKDFTGVFGGFASTQMEFLNLSKWDVSSAVTMADMFHSSTHYTGRGLENWNVSSVEHFNQMFIDAKDFNGNISGWDVTSGIHFKKMFYQTQSFNHSLPWNMSRAQNVNDMFKDSSFDGDVSGMTVVTLQKMFRRATHFTGRGVETWNTTSVTNIDHAFESAHAFNGNVTGWSFPKLTSASHAFRDAYAFDGDVTNWGMPKVWNFIATFQNARAFHGTGLDSWNLTSALRFDHCFRYANVFNSPIPNITKATNLRYAFDGAEAFNGTITIPPQVTSLSYTFAGTKAAGIVIPSTVTSLYGTFQSADTSALDVARWNVSNVHTMTMLFASSDFDGTGVEAWNTRSLTVATGAFWNTEFDANVSQWDTSKIVTMASLFRNTPMNHSVATWNITSTTNMNRMFSSAPKYCEGWPSSWDTVGSRDVTHIYYGAATTGDCTITPPPTQAPTPTPTPSPSDDSSSDSSSDETDDSSSDSSSHDEGPYYSKISVVHEGPYYTKEKDCEDVWLSCHDGHTKVTITHTYNGTYNKYTGAQFHDLWYPSGNHTSDETGDTPPRSPHTATHATAPCTFTNPTALKDALDAKCEGDTTYDSSTYDSPCSVDDYDGDVSSWDVSALTSLHRAFQGLDCALNVTGWDVRAVTDMSYMLYQVGSSFSITGLETWSTTNLRNLNHFAEQSHAKESAIKGLANWDVSDVTTMHKAFAGYHYPNNFNDDLSKWDVRNVTTMNQMFREAPLFWAEIGMWNTISLQTKPDWRYAGTTRIFENADAIHKTPPTNLARWDFCRGPAPSDFPVHAQRYNGSDWCANNTDPADDRDAHTHTADDISFYWTKSACEYKSLVDEACISVALEPKADYGHVWVWNRTQFKCKFTNANLKSAIHAKCRNGTISSTALTTVADIADLCRTAVDISTWDVSEVTSLRNMFDDVGNPPCDLTGIGEWDVSSVTNMHHAFSSWANPQEGKDPGSWQNLDLSRWNMSQVTTIRRIFYHSTDVEIGDISDWDLCDITDSPGSFSDYFSKKRHQNDFRRLPGKPLCGPTTNESAPYPSGDRTYYFNEAACGQRCDSQYVNHNVGTMWYNDTFTTPTLICGTNRSLYDSQQGCTRRQNGESCAEVRNKYMLNNDSQCDSVDGAHGTYWLSETACGLLCDRRSDDSEDTYWYNQAQTRTELICGENKTVYDSAVGCAQENHGVICTESPEGRWVQDNETSCVGAITGMSPTSCRYLAVAASETYKTVHDSTWPSGCTFHGGNHKYSFNTNPTKSGAVKPGAANGECEKHSHFLCYPGVERTLDIYYLSPRVCEAKHDACEEDYDVALDVVYAPRNANRTELICGENRTVYEYPTGCKAANDDVECTEIPSGRWVQDNETSCTAGSITGTSYSRCEAIAANHPSVPRWSTDTHRNRSYPTFYTFTTAHRGDHPHGCTVWGNKFKFNKNTAISGAATIGDKCTKRDDFECYPGVQRTLESYYLSQRVCEAEHTACEEDYDVSLDVVYVPRDTSRTELICGQNKTVYEYPAGCKAANNGTSCTESPEGRWLRDQDTLCASILYDGVPHVGNYSLSKRVCEADNDTCVHVDDGDDTRWWHHDAQTRTELICGVNKTVYDDPDGCMEFNHDQNCTESPEGRWLHDDETDCASITVVPTKDTCLEFARLSGGKGSLKEYAKPNWYAGHKGCSIRKSSSAVHWNTNQPNRAATYFDRVRPVLHGDYFLSQRACGGLPGGGVCVHVLDEHGDTYWYPQTQTRIVEICGENKTAYDSSTGCNVANSNRNCTEKRGAWLAHVNATCAHIDGELSGNYFLSAAACGSTCDSRSGSLDTYWYPQTQTRIVEICGENKTAYDSSTGCNVANSNRNCTEKRGAWLAHVNATCAHIDGELSGNYFLSAAACGSTCDSRSGSLDTYWYPQTQTRTELICEEIKTVYDSAAGCADANDNAECAESPEGRYLRDDDVNCDTHYVSEAACRHVGETCVQHNGMYMTETQRVAHWQCVFESKSTLETAAEKWCGGPESPPTERHLIDSSYGNCTLDISQWDVSAITSFHMLFNAQHPGSRRLNKTCNPNVGDWDMSSATTIAHMFRGQYSFTRNLSSWNTAKVRDVQALFLWTKVPASGIWDDNTMNFCSVTSDFHHSGDVAIDILGKTKLYHVPGSDFCNKWNDVESCGHERAELRVTHESPQQRTQVPSLTTTSETHSSQMAPSRTSWVKLAKGPTLTTNARSRIELRRALRAYGASRADAKAIFQLARSDFTDILGGFAEKARSSVQVPQPGTRTHDGFRCRFRLRPHGGRR